MDTIFLWLFELPAWVKGAIYGALAGGIGGGFGYWIGQHFNKPSLGTWITIIGITVGLQSGKLIDPLLLRLGWPAIVVRANGPLPKKIDDETILVRISFSENSVKYWYTLSVDIDNQLSRDYVLAKFKDVIYGKKECKSVFRSMPYPYVLVIYHYETKNGDYEVPMRVTDCKE